MWGICVKNVNALEYMLQNNMPLRKFCELHVLYMQWIEGVEYVSTLCMITIFISSFIHSSSMNEKYIHLM